MPVRLNENRPDSIFIGRINERSIHIARAIQTRQAATRVNVNIGERAADQHFPIWLYRDRVHGTVGTVGRETRIQGAVCIQSRKIGMIGPVDVGEVAADDDLAIRRLYRDRAEGVIDGSGERRVQLSTRPPVRDYRYRDRADQRAAEQPAPASRVAMPDRNNATRPSISKYFACLHDSFSFFDLSFTLSMPIPKHRCDSCLWLTSFPADGAPRPGGCKSFLSAETP